MPSLTKEVPVAHALVPYGGAQPFLLSSPNCPVIQTLSLGSLLQVPARKTVFCPQLCHYLVVRPWASHLTLCISFPSWRVELTLFALLYEAFQ